MFKRRSSSVTDSLGGREVDLNVRKNCAQYPKSTSTTDLEAKAVSGGSSEQQVSEAQKILGVQMPTDQRLVEETIQKIIKQELARSNAEAPRTTETSSWHGVVSSNTDNIIAQKSIYPLFFQ